MALQQCVWYWMLISGENLFTVLDVKFVCACNKASRYCTPTFSRFYADFLQIIHLLYIVIRYTVYIVHTMPFYYMVLSGPFSREYRNSFHFVTQKNLRWIDMDRNIDKMDIQLLSYFVGGCGSCYAFSSMGMNEARWRIRTNNTEQPVFSPQDIVECSQYSQGTYMYWLHLIYKLYFTN